MQRRHVHVFGGLEEVLGVLGVVVVGGHDSRQTGWQRRCVLDSAATKACVWRGIVGVAPPWACIVRKSANPSKGKTPRRDGACPQPGPGSLASHVDL